MNFRTRLNSRRCTELGQGLCCLSATGLQQFAMALTDSRYDCSDPGYIHVVVTPVGEKAKANNALCAKVLGALRDALPVQFKDAVVFMRFVKDGDLPKWVEHHIRWEELFSYKQVFGELVVACCNDKEELEKIEAALAQSNAAYRRTVCCTKYLVLGAKEQLESLTEEKEYVYFIGTSGKGPLDTKAIEQALSDLARGCANVLRQQILAASRQDSVKLFRSQFDLNNPSAEEDVKSFGRGVIQGRTQKHLGDLYLLSGLYQEASTSYLEAVNTLSSVKDPLWLASAYEGLCTVAVMSKRCEDVIGQKTHHTKIKRGSLTATLKAATSGTFSRWFSIRRNAEGGNSVADQSIHPSPSNQSFGSEKDSKDGGTSESSSGSPMDWDTENGEEQEQLRVNFIVKNYSRALENYRKSGPIADIPRVEATIRFSAFLASQELNADACDILNDLSTLTAIQDEDKGMMFEMMGDFCSSLHYTRKASFYYHCAAEMFAVSKPTANINKAVELLKKSFAGYRLPVGDNNLPTGSAVSAYVDGWPSLKVCVLRDFLLSASNDSMIVWCATFLFQYYSSLLQQGDLQEIIKALTAMVQNQNQNQNQNLSSPGTGAVPQQAPSVDAPFPVTKVPTVNLFRPKEFQSELTLHRRPDYASEGSGEGPFIYSALKSKKKGMRQEVAWIVGQPCEVAMEISNPFPVELRIDEMRVLVEGVSADIFSASLTLPVSSVPQNFVLLVVPKETGFLNILGYEAVLFGLKSKCTMKIPGDPVVKVVPPLPLLKVRSTRVVPIPSGHPEALPAGDKENSETSLTLTNENDVLQLMDGESYACEFQVESTYDVPVEHLCVTSEEWDRDYCHLSYDKDSVTSLVPLRRGSPAIIRVNITARIPPYLRVNNDFTRGIAKPTLLSYSPGSITTKLSDDLFRSVSSSPEKPIDLDAACFNQQGNPNRQHSVRLTNGSPSPLSQNRRVGKTSTLPRQLPSQSPSGGRKTISARKRIGYDEVDLNKMQHRRSLRLPDGSPSPDQQRHQILISSNSDSVSMHKSETVPSDLAGHGGEEGLVDSLHPLYSLQATAKVGGVAISGPTGPLYKAVPTPPSKKQVKCSLMLMYSGQSGHEAGYCRTCELRTTVNVKPLLGFGNFEVFQVERLHHLWCLKFEVKNLSKSELDITAVISPECSDAIGCLGTLDFKLSPKQVMPLEFKLKRFVIPDSEMAGAVTQSDLIKVYCDRIAKWVRFYWHTSKKGSEGVVDLTGLRLPMATLDYIKPAPVQFVMKLNGELRHLRNEVLDCKAGIPVQVALDIINTSGFILPSSTFKLLPFQFSEQENKIKAVTGNVLIHTNTLTTSIPQMEIGCSFTHMVYLIFLFRGTYHVNVSLSMDDQPGGAMGTEHITRERGGAGAAGSSQDDSKPLSSKSSSCQAGSLPCPVITVSAGSSTTSSSLPPATQQFQGREFPGPHIILSVT